MISTHTSILYSGMYTSSYTLYASRGSKCVPSCFDLPGLLNIESYGTIHGRHRVHFRSDHHAQQHTHCQNKFYKHHSDGREAQHGKMHSKCRLLPDHIVCKITQRNIERANTCDPALKLLNEKITSDIQKHKENLWKEHVDAPWDHRHSTHILWKTIHGIFNRLPPPTLNTGITFNNKISTTPKHIVSPNNTQTLSNTVKHETNRSININVIPNKCDEPTSCLVQPIGTHGGEVMSFWCVCFRGELGFLNCDDICLCIVNKQFELLEFVFVSVYVDLQYNLDFSHFYCWVGVLVLCLWSCGRLWSVCDVGLSVTLSWYPMWMR